jgi:hypothetical protein
LSTLSSSLRRPCSSSSSITAASSSTSNTATSSCCSSCAHVMPSCSASPPCACALAANPVMLSKMWEYMCVYECVCVCVYVCVCVMCVCIFLFWHRKNLEKNRW